MDRMVVVLPTPLRPTRGYDLALFHVQGNAEQDLAQAIARVDVVDFKLRHRRPRLDRSCGPLGHCVRRLAIRWR